ncbi:MAG: hypothetical protein DRP65_05340 [Planctomycetota bacterium]|nr:MAG: hypothetical protein DRP65_05340 [Planctomycetota bacterium]
MQRLPGNQVNIDFPSEEQAVITGRAGSRHQVNRRLGPDFPNFVNIDRLLDESLLCPYDWAKTEFLSGKFEKSALEIKFRPDKNSWIIVLWLIALF